MLYFCYILGNIGYDAVNKGTPHEAGMELQS